MNKNIVTWGIGLVAVFSLIVSLGVTDGINGADGQDGRGAVASPEVYSYLRVHGAFTQGGQVRATSSTMAATSVLLATDLMEYSIIDFTSNVDLTPALTLPATSTLKDAVIPNAGDYRTWVIRNASSSVSGITIGAGTGIDLQEPDGQNIVIAEYGWLTCYRLATTDVVCRVDETIAAD